MRTNLFATLLVSSLVTAQSFVVPPGTTPVNGTCNAFPFSTSDMRYQAQVRAVELGSTPGIISGIAFAPCTSGVRSMRQIRVRLAHFNGGTMSTTFDSNLNTPGPAQTVLDTTDHRWHMVANAWNEIGLQDAFFYNGVDDLVVEVLVIGSSGASAATHREGTNQRVYLGSYTGQATGTNGGNTAFKLKLFLGDANTQLFGQSCQGSAGIPAFALNGTAQLGTNLDLVCSSAPPSSPVYFMVGFDTHLPFFPFDLGFAGASGCTLYHDVTASAGVLTDPAGTATLTLAIPTAAPIAGIALYASALVLDLGANAAGVTTTNYGRALLGN